MNISSVSIMVQYALKMILILAVVFVIALLTPKMAKKISGVLPKKKNPERVDNCHNDDVKGIYDAQQNYNNENNKDGEADKNG